MSDHDGLSAGRLAWAVGLLSAAALGYQLLLPRLYAVSLGHPLAAFAVSLSLLGFAAAGTALALWRETLLGKFAAAFPLSAVLFGLATLGATTLALEARMPPEEALWRARTLLTLGAQALLPAVVFFCAGLGLASALARMPERIFALCRAELLGGAAASVLTVGALAAFRPELCLKLTALVGFLAACTGCLAQAGGRGKVAALLIFLGGACLFSFYPEAAIRTEPGPHRPLARFLELPGAAVIESRSGPSGRVELAASPQVPLRYAPGLSSQAAAEPAEQMAVFVDGEAAGVATRRDGGRRDLRFLDFLPTAAPYRLLTRPRVLALQLLGGFPVLEAAWHDARAVDVAEDNPDMLALLRGHAANDFAGGLLAEPRVHVHEFGSRALLERVPGPFELVVLWAAGETPVAAQALGEDWLLTTQAARRMLGVLAPEGMLSASCGAAWSPGRGLKLLATLAAALRDLGLPPGERLLCIRTPETFTVLARRTPFPVGDVAQIRAFCARMDFALDYAPGLDADPSPESARNFGEAGEAWSRETIRALAAGGQGSLAGSPWHLEPASDERPYFSRFFAWRGVAGFASELARGELPAAEWGYPLTLAALGLTLLAGLGLTILPALAQDAPFGPSMSRWRVGLGFAALGLAFPLLLIACGKKLTLLVGQPLFATAATGAAFLACAGLGSAAAGRAAVWTDATRKALWLGCAFAAGGVLLFFALAAGASATLAGVPLWVRALAAGLCVAPPAFGVGWAFPLGLSLVASRMPEWTPWAWTASACAAVVAPSLTLVLSAHLGFTAALILGTALQTLAVALLAREAA